MITDFLPHVESSDSAYPQDQADIDNGLPIPGEFEVAEAEVPLTPDSQSICANAEMSDDGDDDPIVSVEKATGSIEHSRRELLALAEQGMGHLLRTPELFRYAQQHLKSTLFTSLGRWELADVWSCAQQLVERQGPEILKSKAWLMTLEQEMRRQNLVGTSKTMLFGDGQFNEGFFKRLAAKPESEFDEARGHWLLKRMIAGGSLVQPLNRLLAEIRRDPLADPDALAEKLGKLVQSYRDKNVSSNPMFMSPANFAAADFTIEWLVPRVLVANQPCIVGGPSKSLKTSLMVDLAVSIGSGNGTKFLNEFEVKGAGKRVGFISGESGGATIKETFLRVCRVREVNLAECNVYPEFRLPKLGQSKEVQHLASQIRRHSLQVIIIDPIYLTLLAGNKNAKAPNLFDMGPLLGDLSQACLDAGATPIFVHHTVKHLSQLKTDGMYNPIELENLSQSGFAEFARQWMLVNRRAPYKDGTGEHELWLRIAGSAGFGSLWGVDIVEGVVRDDFGGRNWFVTVKDQAALKQVASEHNAKRKLEKKWQDDLETKKLFTVALGKYPQGETYTTLRATAGISRSRDVMFSLEDLVKDGVAESVMVTKNRRTWSGYKLAAPALPQPTVNKVVPAIAPAALPATDHQLTIDSASALESIRVDDGQ